MKNTILITGGAGFIGSHLTDALLARGFDVVVMDVRGPKDGGLVNPAARFIQADLTTSEAMEAVRRLRPDVIFHFAANANVAKSVANPALDYEINFAATARLLEVAKDVGVKRFIFASTGGALSSEDTTLPTPECATAKPKSPYAVHKLMSEQLGEAYRDLKGLPFVALRFANVYGPRQSASKGESNVIATFASRMSKDEETGINGAGTQTRDYVYVSDVIDACLRVLDLPDAKGPFNVGTSREVDVVTIHRLLSREFGYTRVPNKRPPDLGAPQRSCLDILKAKWELGWQPQVSLEEGLRRTVEWYQKEIEPVTPLEKVANP